MVRKGGPFFRSWTFRRPLGSQCQGARTPLPAKADGSFGSTGSSDSTRAEPACRPQQLQIQYRPAGPSLAKAFSGGTVLLAGPRNKDVGKAPAAARKAGPCRQGDDLRDVQAARPVLVGVTPVMWIRMQAVDAAENFRTRP